MTRTKGKRSPALFYIFAEGEVTEKNYFENNSFGRKPRTDNKRPRVNEGKRKGQNPKNIKKWVENTLTRPFNKRDIVWIVIDRDRNSREELDDLKRWCDGNGFRLALSDPMFEYWFLLHFNFCDTVLNEDELNRRLTRYLGCKYEKTRCYNERLAERTDDAIRNARTLRKGIDEDRYFDHSPFTNVDLIVEDVRKYMDSG